MADKKQLETLKQGTAAWNKWRQENAGIAIDLSEADLRMDGLSEANLSRANLSRANLSGNVLNGVDLALANLSGANLSETFLPNAELNYTDFRGAHLERAYLIGASFEGTCFIKANLSGANLKGADLRWANLSEANLSGANLSDTDLRGVNLSGANLSGANLSRASVIETNLEGAQLNGCQIYGISVWDPILKNAEQSNLVITPAGQSVVTVDDLKVAQFIYLVLHNQNIRDVIQTIGQKGVLILGRFTLERKPILDAIADTLRKKGYLPIIFDFERPTSRDFTETIMTLAGLSRFVIADITNPKSSPLELQATVPNYMIPFAPIIQEGEKPFAMFVDLQNKYDWVLQVLEYDTKENLASGLEEAIIKPALLMHDQLMLKKAQAKESRNIKEFLGQNALDG